MTPPRATVAFVPREQFSTTERSLETLFERTRSPFELVCIDGGSPPPVAQYLERAARQRNFTLIRSDQWLSPNQARNLALSHVRTPYVVFVDNDVLVSDDWLQPLVECADQTGAWVVGPLYFEFEPEGERLHMFGGQCRIERLPNGGRDYVERHSLAHRPLAEVSEPLARCPTELIEFHSVLVAMAAFDALGPLDEGLLCNAEHGDLCLQVRAAGREVWLEPRSRITYAPPQRLTGADRAYFRLRWSEAWADANNRRLQEKWDLSPDAPGLVMASRWVAGHRRYSLPWLGRMRRLVGRKLASAVEKRLVAPWERALNRREYPAVEFGRLADPQPRIVWPATFAAAAA